MDRQITTITIVHEVENDEAARHDVEVIKTEIRRRLIALSIEQKIGSVRAVTLYQSVRMK